MQKLVSWVNTHVKEFNKQDILEMSNNLFFREENRPSINDKNVFMSPADGIVIGVSKVKLGSNESIINAKGVNYTIEEMFGNNKKYIQQLYNKTDDDNQVYVIDVFMTFYDIHSNRVPYQSYQVDFEQISPLKTFNYPMIKTEESLFNGDLGKALGCTNQYLKNNQRAITTFRNNNVCKGGLTYFCVQLADDVVDVITNFWEHKPTQMIRQSIKFGVIRYGSGCSLVIPINKKDGMDVEPIIQVGDHVEGGIDGLFKISMIDGNPKNLNISYDYNTEITDENYQSYFDNLAEVTYNDLLEGSETPEDSGDYSEDNY